jgi:hypothetical protein
LPRLGAALAAAGRPDQAAAALDRGVEVAQRLRMPGSLAEAYAAQAGLAAADPDRLSRAVELHHAALTICVDHRLRAAQLDTLEALAQVGAALQPAADDVRLLHAAETARTDIGLPREAGQQRAYDRRTADLRRALGPPRTTGRRTRVRGSRSTRPHLGTRRALQAVAPVRNHLEDRRATGEPLRLVAGRIAQMSSCASDEDSSR